MNTSAYDQNSTAYATNESYVQPNIFELRAFKNGDTIIHNVPYTKDFRRYYDKSSYDLYLTHEVLLQLSHIIKYMQLHKISDIDYQKFIVEYSRLEELSSKNRGVSVGTYVPATYRESDTLMHPLSKKQENIVSQKSSNSEITDDEKDKIRRMTLNCWINHYFKVTELQKEHESITTFERGDTPTATEWLAHFHQQLDAMPSIEKELIEKKYLTQDNNGKHPIDEDVASELFISLRQYYYRKKEALYRFGVLLGDAWEYN